MKTQEHNGQRFGAMACSTFFVTGWQRKYRPLDGCNEPYVARVYRRLLDADDRWQSTHRAGKYSFPTTSSPNPHPRKTNMQNQESNVIEPPTGEDSVQEIVGLIPEIGQAWRRGDRVIEIVDISETRVWFIHRFVGGGEDYAFKLREKWAECVKAAVKIEGTKFIPANA
jgi:hypothetical protein